MQDLSKERTLGKRRAKAKVMTLDDDTGEYLVASPGQKVNEGLDSQIQFRSRGESHVLQARTPSSVGGEAGISTAGTLKFPWTREFVRVCKELAKAYYQAAQCSQ